MADKDYSESKDETLRERCKLCDEPLPTKALYRLNQIAISQGFCSWICCSMAFGKKGSEAKLKEMLNADSRKRKGI